jgi:glycosyltransferase involved in cell wall biosynthesis
MNVSATETAPPSDHPPIGIVWSEDMPFVQHAGGSETYTALQIKQLVKLGYAVNFYAFGKTKESDLGQLDIPIHTPETRLDLSKADDTFIFPIVPDYEIDDLRRNSHVILHVPATGMQPLDEEYFRKNGVGIHTPIVTSTFMAGHWQEVLDLQQPPSVVYPPTDPAYGLQSRPTQRNSPPRALFAGRPTPEKGIFVLFASLESAPLTDEEFDMTCVKTINHDGGTEIINALFDAHPGIRTTDARPDPASMAELYSQHDVVVMPSIWTEPFGMISVEAQHAGCRVVASDIGGLPETDCGSLVLTAPNDYKALAQSISAALRLGPLSQQEREAATTKFTVEDSVSALLRAIELEAR